MFRMRFKTSLIGLSISLMLMALLVTNGVGMVFASDPCSGIPDCISITSGTLTAPLQAPSLSSDQITLDGTDQSVALVTGTSGGPLVEVIDATGAGAGWNVQIKASAFTSTTYTLTNASVEVDWGQMGNSATSLVSCGTNSSCTLPADNTSDAVADNAHLCALTSTSGVTAPSSTPFVLTTSNQLLCNAAVGTGLGTINLDPKMTVNLPANVYATGATLDGTDTFTTTITLTSSSGPA